ncbi:hypothetical protein BC938DRAFT_479508 [Jimgerdemannia flammicorona]|uniref:Galactose oxidase n=1 Tax=Jimgerdemannia flammicorona TaxID=994334 RepID=A0A433QY22_9FUNG|nr:hypothetical protein BC938DRAFT_479508 [Jimgerdemannia flammicorona]
MVYETRSSTKPPGIYFSRRISFWNWTDFLVRAWLLWMKRLFYCVAGVDCSAKIFRLERMRRPVKSVSSACMFGSSSILYRRPITMHRPLRMTALLLILVVIIALATASSAATTEARVGARAVLLNKTIWIYGGLTGADGKVHNLLSRLDVSVGWETSHPPYVDHTTDGLGAAPNTSLGTLFPSADQSAFYSVDVYGPGQTFTFAKYDIATRAWTLFPTTGQIIPNAGPAAHDNMGNTWFDPNLQLWKTNASPSPIATREFYTANLLPTGMIIVTGGLYQIQNDQTWINIWADMADTPTYNTTSGVWRNNTAIGLVPRPRNMHTATLSMALTSFNC